MEIKIDQAGEKHNMKPERVPLLQGQKVEGNGQDHKEKVGVKFRGLPAPSEAKRSSVQNAISKTFKGTAHLANLLPTGTVIAFQLLSPVVTHNSTCSDASRFLTASFLILAGLACFLSSFTDTIKDESGAVSYVFATFNGFWVIDGSTKVSDGLEEKIKIGFIDFVHGFMSVMVFAAVVLFDENAIKCFIPTPSSDVEEILSSLPVGLGVICSMLFVAFPSQRRGLGFPTSEDTENNPKK